MHEESKENWDIWDICSPTGSGMNSSVPFDSENNYYKKRKRKKGLFGDVISGNWLL